jgi:hypothetical protein
MKNSVINLKVIVSQNLVSRVSRFRAAKDQPVSISWEEVVAVITTTKSYT